ncbi:hypothetical protein F5Y19DRAFT_462068 [Xylariaceae sp. FL1651]|nr:hypothetical protein F5Y19DRAFT_462068 [Xylariaceae sp. FL1651]
MSVDSRELDHTGDELLNELISPLSSPRHNSPVQGPLHRSSMCAGHDDTTSISTSTSDQLASTLETQLQSESIRISPPLACYTPTYGHVNVYPTSITNYHHPFPSVPSNSDSSRSFPEHYGPNLSQTKVLSPDSCQSLPTSWWWWWEILAMILSIIAIHDIPLEAWELPFQPHALIAILTTVGKAALLVPAASCISQLKWRHFSRYPRKLIDLQLFDDASRGPWGSAVLVWHLAFRARILVTLGFALVTVLALGIDTSVQQIINIPTKESLLGNVSVELGTADMYFSKGFYENTLSSSRTWSPNPDLLAIQSSIINGATGSVFLPYFNCPRPASQCKWETFTTLGVCAAFRNVSAVAVPNCSVEDSSDLNCTYSFPGMVSTGNSDEEMVMGWTSEFEGDSLIGSFLAVKATKDGYPVITDDGTPTPPPTEVYYSTFKWCAKEFQNVSASQKGINPGLVTAKDLKFVDNVAVGDEGNLMGTNYYVFVDNSTGSTFNVSKMVWDFLPIYLHTLLSTTVYHNVYRPDIGPGNTLLAVGFALMESNLSLVIPNIADTLTNQIRSNNPGDNYNATKLAGKTFFDEPYIQIRWDYFILPALVTSLSAILLTITIIITDKQPLLRHSLMALLINRLDGRSDEELDVHKPQTQEKLDHLAESMLASLEADGQGRMKLVKKKLD